MLQGHRCTTRGNRTKPAPAQSRLPPRTLAEKVFSASLEVFVAEQLLEKPLLSPYTHMVVIQGQKLSQAIRVQPVLLSQTHFMDFHSPSSGLQFPHSLSSKTRITANHTGFAKGCKSPSPTFSAVCSKPSQRAAEDSERSALLHPGRISASHRCTPTPSPGLESPQTHTTPILTLHYPSRFPPSVKPLSCSLHFNPTTSYPVCHSQSLPFSSWLPRGHFCIFTLTLYRM